MKTNGGDSRESSPLLFQPVGESVLLLAVREEVRLFNVGRALSEEFVRERIDERERVGNDAGVERL